MVVNPHSYPRCQPHQNNWTQKKIHQNPHALHTDFYTSPNQRQALHAQDCEHYGCKKAEPSQQDAHQNLCIQDKQAESGTKDGHCSLMHHTFKIGWQVQTQVCSHVPELRRHMCRTSQTHRASKILNDVSSAANVQDNMHHSSLQFSSVT